MYAKIFNGAVAQYPYEWADFLVDNNNTNYPSGTDMEATFPATDLGQQGYSCVTVTCLDQPLFNPATEVATLHTQPALVDGRWVLDWTVVALTDDEKNVAATKKADLVRLKRNTKLAESDWTQVADSPVDKSAWAVYRQALRDISAQAGFPWGVVWPEQPA